WVAHRSVALIIARRRRLVATGFLQTKSRCPANMQQKYCDQGRSVALLKMTRPTLRLRNSCGSGGKPRNAAIFPSANNSMGVGEGVVIERILCWGWGPT